MKFPSKTTLKELSKNFKVEFCSLGPTKSGWEGHYLECPECSDLVEKAGCHSCRCGNVFVDDGMLRIAIENGKEGEVKTYYAYKK
jgi:hypothetical protein